RRHTRSDRDWSSDVCSSDLLLDQGYLKSRSKLIDMKRAQNPGAGSPPKGGTVYLTAADASGMMVSMIQSNFSGFGSGVVVPGTRSEERRVGKEGSSRWGGDQ